MKIPSFRTFFTKPLYAAGLAAVITLLVKYFDNRNKTFIDPDRKPMLEYLKAMAFSAALVGGWVFVMNKLSGSSADSGDYAGGFSERYPSEPRISQAPQPTSFGGTRFDRSFERPRPSAVPYNRGI